MKLKFTAQIDTGNIEIYEESNMNKPNYKVNVETEDNKNFKMEVMNKEDKIIGEVKYSQPKAKLIMVDKYLIDNLETGEKTAIDVKPGRKMFIGENKEMYVLRSPRDRKILLYDKDKLIMILKCKTFIRNWLRGEYTAEIFDESYASFCVFVTAVLLNIIFEEHNCTSVKF